MCGIAGIFRIDGGGEISPERLEPALALLAHRGPDGGGMYAGEGVLLGNRRLAVIDRPGGAQPMSTPDGDHVLTFNGEIHDYREHRARLERDGERFRTNSDTEVLLTLLGRSGPAALAEVTGMFAFGLYEKKAGRLTLARDPFGVKPLLYSFDESGGEIRFASELAALLSLDSAGARLDIDALVERIAFQVPLTNRTLVRNARSLPPGTMLVAERGAVPRVERWHEVTYSPEEKVAEADWIGLLRETLRRSVRLALRSDVPLGVTLSGGLDSSLVAGLAAAEAGQVLAFTGYFEEGEAYDERSHARRAARELGLELVEVPVTAADLLDHVRELAVRLEGPVAGPGSLPQLVVAERAAESVTVLLTGQGADETFGGYARHRIAWLEAQAALDPDRLPADLLPYEPLVRHLLARGAGDPFPDRYYRLVHRGEGIGELLGEVLVDAAAAYDQREAFRGAFREEDGDPFHRMVSFDRRILLPALLHVEDRVTMARSLESRVPLLDPEIVSLSARIPSRIAFGGGELKRILRLAARGAAPPSALARRDKMGFPVPLAEWARGPLKAPLRERLQDGPLVPSGILAEDAPEKLLARAGDHGRHLWFFLLLSEWMEETGIRP